MEFHSLWLLALVLLSALSDSDGEPPHYQTRLHCGKGEFDVNRVDTTHRLENLRFQMRRVDAIHGPPIQAFIITSDDEHQSENVAEHDRRMEYITGFTGSQGEAVVTETKAALWIDGRYFLQADRELDCNWQLMRAGLPNVSNMTKWLKETLKPGSRVGADARIIANYVWETWREELAESRITLVAVSTNLVDLIWTTGRADYSAIPAFPHPIEYAGKEWTEKVEDIRKKMKMVGADAYVITALDDIAWLLNVRGRDIPFVPVVRAYVILTNDLILLYAPPGKFNSTHVMRMHLRSERCYGRLCVRIHDYSNIWDDLKTLSQAWNKVLLPASYSYTMGASHAIYNAVPMEKRMPMPSLVMRAKAQKNQVEREGMRRAHVRDAVALCDFFAYLESQVSSGSLNETFVAESVDRFRRQQELIRGASFETIAAFGPNGALPHYSPPRRRGTLSAPGVHREGPPLFYGGLKIDNSSTLVLDSGGQYYDGTTDVSRTLHFGKPTAMQKEAYTRVLSGLLNLASLVFPAGKTEVADVDVLARAPLWAAGLDYRHGSGHGVGAFLSVHEAPINLNFDSTYEVAFEEGNFFSDEPGYYQDGEFGVRLENVLEVVKAETKYKFDGPYLGFRSVTLVPFEPKLIDLELLSNDQSLEITFFHEAGNVSTNYIEKFMQTCSIIMMFELPKEKRRMLNNYNAQIRTTVGAELKRQKRMQGFYWMMSKTLHIPECKTKAANTPTTSSSPPSILSGVYHPIAFALIALVSYLSS